MRITLISPRLAFQKGDFLGSGVPYWPLELLTLASFARDTGDNVALLDLFGSNPKNLTESGDSYLQGMPIDIYLNSPVLKQAEAFILYAISYMAHNELVSIVRKLRISYPEIPISILENSQAVTAYSLQRVADTFFDAGADLLICGEPYFNWDSIKLQLIGADHKTLPDNLIDRYSSRFPQRIVIKNASYPVPAWDLLNLESYWSLPYSHGPKTKKFIPVLTSRGCPYPCDFCVVPETNNRSWRGNSPEEVVSEIIALRDRFNVRDFQVEDLNPTVQHQRWERICELLIERNANIRFYFVSGTKAETVRIDKVPLFAEAGCKYISISPESGSADLMKIVGKKFNYQHGLELIKACRKYGIRTQACLLVGHPEENEASHQMSKIYLANMVKAGLDEVAIFIVAPFAGSLLFANSNISLSDEQALPSFSPKGRIGYSDLERRRRDLIKTFFVCKTLYGSDLLMQGIRALFGVPQTKMENLPRRILFILFLIIKKKTLQCF
jgi:anaerobic magnesium-protoporphyrin IX monomethyl ester cyclase